MFLLYINMRYKLITDININKNSLRHIKRIL